MLENFLKSILTPVSIIGKGKILGSNPPRDKDEIVRLLR